MVRAVPDDHAATVTPSVLFRDAMRNFPAAVCIIATHEGSRTAAMTATAVMSFSASPPSLLCSIDHAARSHDALQRCRLFSVSVLHHEQSPTALAFARSDDDKFTHADLEVDATHDVPVIAGALTSLICRKDATYAHFDHTMLLGVVIGGHVDVSRAPLLYAERRFWSLVSTDGQPRPKT